MQYFVSTENTPYNNWQLELLIESFKHHHCEKDLLVVVAEEQNEFQPYPYFNIENHKRIYEHVNIGKQQGYSPLNSVYSMIWAVENNQIAQPFISLPIDTILSNPNYDFDFNSNYSEIIFKPDPFLTIAEAEKNVGPIWHCLENTKEYYEENWVPVGSIMGFNHCGPEIFHRTISLMQTLAIEQIIKKNQIWKHTDRLAWAINLADLNEKIVLRENYSLSTSLLSFDKTTPFIDYEYGIPPIFNKSMFQYLPPEYISFGNPYEVLKDAGSTPNAFLLSQLANNILKSHDKNSL